MRTFITLTIAIALLISVAPVMADQAEDEAAIRKAMKELFTTWNAKDLETHFTLIDENYAESDLKKGKAAHRKRLETLFSSEGYTQVKQEEIDIVFLTPDVAIYRGHGEDLKTALKWTASWIFLTVP